MSLSANQQPDNPVVSTHKAPSPPSAGAWLWRVGPAVAALLGVCVLAAGCAGRSAAPSVASLGRSAATTTGSSTAASPSAASPSTTAIRYIDCMRTHGDPSMPDPTIVKNGQHVSVNIDASPGVDANSSQFSTANNACKHLLPDNGVPKENTITPADQADYLKAVACMRSHGFPDFPDPTFRNDHVSFSSSSAIDTNSPKFTSALTTCQKLIPAGLPYSSSGS
jgi:hypothetical protein